MRILYDYHRQQHLRLCYQGLTITRLQSNSGKTVIMKNQEFEKLKVLNGVYGNESWAIAESSPLTINLN